MLCIFYMCRKQHNLNKKFLYREEYNMVLGTIFWTLLQDVELVDFLANLTFGRGRKMLPFQYRNNLDSYRFVPAIPV